jgi:LmbE family N-acetylglucosaminyl deacetylase
METKKRVILCVAVHGEDAEFMVGGTPAKPVDEGDDLHLLIATKTTRVRTVYSLRNWRPSPTLTL